MTENNKTTIKIDPPVYYGVNDQLQLVVVENGNVSVYAPTNPYQASALRVLREIIKRESKR